MRVVLPPAPEFVILYRFPGFTRKDNDAKTNIFADGETPHTATVFVSGDVAIQYRDEPSGAFISTDILTNIVFPVLFVYSVSSARVAVTS